jgi:hypothetical protein
MQSKAQQFQVPNSSMMFVVQVFDNESWVAYPYVKDQPDYTNPISDLKYISSKIRGSVKLYINKCINDFAADKVS